MPSRGVGFVPREMHERLSNVARSWNASGAAKWNDPRGSRLSCRSRFEAGCWDRNFNSVFTGGKDFPGGTSNYRVSSSEGYDFPYQNSYPSSCTSWWSESGNSSYDYQPSAYASNYYQFLTNFYQGLPDSTDNFSLYPTCSTTQGSSPYSVSLSSNPNSWSNPMYYPYGSSHSCSADYKVNSNSEHVDWFDYPSSSSYSDSFSLDSSFISSSYSDATANPHHNSVNHSMNYSNRWQSSPFKCDILSRTTFNRNGSARDDSSNTDKDDVEKEIKIRRNTEEEDDDFEEENTKEKDDSLSVEINSGGVSRFNIAFRKPRAGALNVRNSYNPDSRGYRRSMTPNDRSMNSYWGRGYHTRDGVSPPPVVFRFPSPAC